jgi:hypothetical protein
MQSYDIFFYVVSVAYGKMAQKVLREFIVNQQVVKM